MSEQRKKNEKNFLVQGSILAIAGVITKLIGAFYRIPLLNIIGTEGNGYYSVAFSIYSVALMLTSYSLPLAVSKLVSARVAVGEYKNAHKIFRGAITFALLAGGFVALLVFFGADFIATTIMHLDMSAYALRVLAPCILVSTESGIPDFRSVDGLYHQKFKYPPETMLSHSFYMAHKAEFYEFYRAKMLAPDAQPNAAHRKLAQWEQEGKLKAVITQNIDGLHQKAGSHEVLELHGSVLRNYCERCHKFYGLDAILHSTGVPKCTCGGDIKPDVVLYEEGLDEDVMDKALRYIHNADMLIIGGTSLVVYPAAGLVRYYRGRKLVVINKGTVGADIGADLVIDGPIGQVLAQV